MKRAALLENLPNILKLCEKVPNPALGKGTFGLVFKATWLANKKLVAVKMYDNKQKGYIAMASAEIYSLRRLRHENIIGLIEIATDNAQNFYMIMELAVCNLAMLIPEHTTLWPCAQIKAVVRQVLMGLEFCHENRLMHRDLKPENILFMHDNTVKLADFGMAHDCLPEFSKYTNGVTTVCYRDPQLLLGTRTYGVEVDMWSFACLFGELLFCAKMIPADPNAKKGDEHENTDFYLNCIWSLCGTPTYEELADWPNDVQDNVLKVIRGPKTVRAIHKKLGTNNCNVARAKFFTRAAVDLLDKMLVISPKKRLSAEAVLQHAYFQSEYPRPHERRFMVKLNL